MKNLLAFLLLGISATNVFAQSPKGWAVHFTHENDFLGINNKDDNYTGGFKLELETPAFLKFPPFLYCKDDSDIVTTQKISFGGVGYTPQHLEIENVIPNDRPYGSFVYIGIGGNSYNLSRNYSISSELQIGKVGTKGPGELQSWIHIHMYGITTRPVPKGWHNQIGAPGNFAVNYNFQISRLSFHSFLLCKKALKKISDSKTSDNDSTDTEENSENIISKRNALEFGSIALAEKKMELLQTKIIGGANVGTYIDNVYLMYELDLFNWSRSSIFLFNPQLPSFLPSNVNISSHKWIRFNMFFKPGVKLVAYNTMLQGLPFNDNSVLKIPTSDINRVLFEFSLGLDLVIHDNFALRYSFDGRSREYAGGKPFQYWGGVSFTITPQKWYDYKKIVQRH